jgi:hypothetical protein
MRTWLGILAIVQLLLFLSLSKRKILRQRLIFLLISSQLDQNLMGLTLLLKLT